MDDIVIEETMTYVAREIGPMYRITTDQLSNGKFNTGDLKDIINKDTVADAGLNPKIIRP
jgi:hypothetical protein